jgi:hypothetical protein
MGTTGTLSQNLEALGIRERTAGINLALSFVHSRFSLLFGTESAKARFSAFANEQFSSEPRVKLIVANAFNQCK